MAILARDGRSVQVAVTAIPWMGHGELLGIYGIAEDVTERNRLARDLAVTQALAVEASKAKSDFVARMSHELRTPLTGMLATAELLVETTDHDERIELVTAMRRSGRRLLALVDDVLDFGAAGASYEAEEEFDLRAVLRDAVEVAGEVARRKQIEFEVEIDDEVPHRIAVEHTNDGHVTLSVTTVSSQAGGPAVLYRVKDTGAGIDPDRHDAIFEPFNGGEVTAQGPAGSRRGTGLGLSIVKQLVTISGGSVAVDSALGRGSTFSVVMPARAPKDAG